MTTTQDSLHHKRQDILRQEIAILAQKAQDATDYGLTAQDIIDGVKISHQDIVSLSLVLNSQASRIAALEHALRWYKEQMCEGFCKDLKSGSDYHESMDFRCAGCKARAALEGSNPNYEESGEL